MDTIPYEIERKFLIRMPDVDWLKTVAEASQIVQIYLKSEENCSERVRARTANGRTVYTHTKKTHVSSIRRIELEHEVDRESYEQLLRRADPQRRPIEKTRYCLAKNGLLYEIDIFPFWTRQAFLEIELQDENQPIQWPEEFISIREVTDDKRYTNAALALEIPEEDL